MTHVLGLTGSIGMGKTTTARMFAEEGLDVWDADAAVHALYASDNETTRAIDALVPGALRDGRIDREALKAAIARDPALLRKIEALVAPAVARARDDFIARARSDIVVIDHPLLFESGSDRLCDSVAVVSVDPQTQRARVLARGTMSEEMLDTILAKQMPDAEKRARADYVIPTDTLESARAAVREIIAKIREHADA